MRPVVVDADRAAAAIPDGATVAISGSGGGILECDAVLAAIERRYRAGAGPAGLTVVHAFGIGDAGGRGLSTLAHPGLVRRVIGGHWTWSPRMVDLAVGGAIEAYALPAGVISQLLREVGAGRPGLFTRIGLDTFVDPRYGGGAMNEAAAAARPLVELTTVDGREYLRYRPLRVDVALVRGSVVDPLGNVGLTDEPAELDVLAAAQAARAGGGTVIAQVKSRVARPLDPRLVTLPAPLLDLVVLAPRQWQTYRAEFDPGLSGAGPAADPPSTVDWADDATAVIARRAALEVPDGAVLNVGFGIAASVVEAVAEQGRSGRVTTAIEQGLFGGRPETGALFGAAYGASARLASTTQFDLFGGGLLDVCCLGMAEVDATGAVNVSRIGGRVVGPGGFVEISQSARRVVFCGTFTARGLSVDVSGGRLRIRREGSIPKFVAALDHRTFSGRLAVEEGREALYVTERAVFRLTPRGMALVELAPGVSVEADILPYMGFRPIIEDVAPMPASAFAGSGSRAGTELEGDPV
jgi:propionate CoA-transferase